MREHAFTICELNKRNLPYVTNKGSDCVAHPPNMISIVAVHSSRSVMCLYVSHCRHLASFGCLADLSVSDLVRNSKDRFSHNRAHITSLTNQGLIDQIIVRSLSGPLVK